MTVRLGRRAGGGVESEVEDREEEEEGEGEDRGAHPDPVMMGR